MNNLRFAIAQTRPVGGDIETNLEDHVRFTRLAAEKNADIIIFPELSLTGYEPALAGSLAIKPDDQILDRLVALSVEHDIAVIAGAPIANTGGNPFIGSICTGSFGHYLYLKMNLHPGEERLFTGGDEVGILKVKDTAVGLAICADIAHSSHADAVSQRGAAIYAASAFITPQGYEKDSRLLQDHASGHGMAVGMANFCGESGGMESAGRSAMWDESGRLVIEASDSREELIVVEKRSTQWQGATFQPSTNHRPD